MDPILVEAIKTIKSHSNIDSGNTDPKDRDAAIETFKLLKKNGRSLSENDVFSICCQLGWSVPRARELSELAGKIDRGELVKRSSQKKSLPSNIYKIWTDTP